MAISKKLASLILSGSLLSSCQSTHRQTTDTAPAPPLSKAYLKREVLKHIDARKALFLAHQGNLDKALDLLISYQKHDPIITYKILRQLCRWILEEPKANLEESFTALYGAWISRDASIQKKLLNQALQSRMPQLQLAALELYADNPQDKNLEPIIDSLGSPFFAIRLQAAFLLAQKKAPEAVSQIASLMQKTPEELKPLFPKLFALEGGVRSRSILHRLLADPDPAVRVQTILAIGGANRNDLLQDLTPLTSHRSPLELEALAWAFGSLQDLTAQPFLEGLLANPTLSVQVSAARALAQLGIPKGKKHLESIALSGNSLATLTLGQFQGTETTLHEIYLSSPSLTQRTNAAIALLERRDPLAVEGVLPLLVSSPQDYGLIKRLSPTGAFFYWEALPSAKVRWEQDPAALTYNRVYREELLHLCIDLPEEAFIAVARAILRDEHTALLPSLSQLCLNRPSEKVIQLLKEAQKTYSNPLARQYCNLTLFDLQEGKQYGQELIDWALASRLHDAIQFHPPNPVEVDGLSSMQLTPHERSQLLIDAYLTLAKQQTEKSFHTLMVGLRHGNPKNRPLLAGILLQALE